MNRKRDLRPTGKPVIELDRCLDAYPVFVVGSVRSGTSAMMHALREGAGIAGFNEGNVAQLLPVLLAAVDQHYARSIQNANTMIGSVSQEFMETGLKNVFAKAFIDVMGTGRWLDKTPGGAAIIKASVLLVDMFPNAKFIFCKRRGIENVLSRQRKFPDIRFQNHCEAWARTMEAWIEVGPRLGERAVEVDQRDMAVEPGLVADRVENLLSLSPAEREGFLGVLRNTRVQQTRPVQDEKPIALSETGWSEAEQEMFGRVCGPMMQAFGYGLGDTAEARRERAYRFFVPVSDCVAERENIHDKRGFRAVDANRFVMSANPAGEPPAAVRYKQVDVARFRRFSARLRIAGQGAADTDRLVFAFKVERRCDRSVAFAAERAVTGKGAAPWSFELPELRGEFDAILSVRPAGDAPSPERVSGLWIDAQLLS